ncbi:hypothetical protein J1N35_023352 [Gossypium stocksii]|uniref:Uncharacterized protein n=1 Tax=Gossypium stocksii TaxID=47602 RepID=A0A9D3VIN6_9ROSI|nr:hypothetical protein J1N35_023352 [Gossypium stocksii]
MGEERATVLQSESLLVREGAGENSSSVTTTLVLSTFVAASISFGVGYIAGYTSPTQSVIMEDLGLSIAEFSFFGSLLNLGSILGALASQYEASVQSPKSRPPLMHHPEALRHTDLATDLASAKWAVTSASCHAISATQVHASSLASHLQEKERKSRQIAVEILG